MKNLLAIPLQPATQANLQPCSEACAGFRVLSRDHWSEFGLCGNPRSSRHGYPVRIGDECADYIPGTSATGRTSEQINHAN